jgi:hypothetical protein
VPSPVLTKKQNYRLWQGGAFGNKLRAWRTVDEWRASGSVGIRVVLRILLSFGGGPCRYNLLPDDVEGVVAEWTAAKIPREAIMVNEAAPDTVVVLQGEYLNDVLGARDDFHYGHLFYSRVAQYMHVALRQKSEWASGLRADLLLRGTMTPSSYEDWRVLLDQYPGHVLEVSVYDRCLGDVPGRNALVWEVRRY